MTATSPGLRRLVDAALGEARRVLEAYAGSAETVVRIAQLLAETIRADQKILICGNGGSLADAVHFAEEMSGRFRGDRRPLPALALAEAGHITCTANDYGFAEVFARMVTALGRPGDVLIVLSTSGNSENIVRALEAAQAAGMRTVALLGKDGGKLRGRATVEIIAPGTTSDRIQELHMLTLHVLVEAVEKELGLAG